MKKALITQITNCIEKTYSIEGDDYSRRIIIFPLGEVGIQVLNVMKNVYSIEPAFLVDNHKCKYSNNIFDASLFERIDTEDYVVILAATSLRIYNALRKEVERFFQRNHIIELEGMLDGDSDSPMAYYRTKIGKYSYGPICCDHKFISSIGAFCSFATGVDVVPNHEMNYITTHPMIYAGECYEGKQFKYEVFEDANWFFPGIKPKPIV